MPKIENAPKTPGKALGKCMEMLWKTPGNSYKNIRKKHLKTLGKCLENAQMNDWKTSLA